ncbi:DMT family transporter [Achromobacter pestifer]|uniref:DMT family transporter n=1 Tax=Achromobacter pestifer TaxID=1353889 RepID=A0A7D4INQ6_9BURK|nr:DMT family transporter [Achromobacter pestifer]QKH39683.1 DMT family transporter [Achromobacter pestifer]
MFVMATWGLNIVSVKYLTLHMDVQALAAVRIVIAFITVTLIIKARRGRIPRLGRAELGWVALAGFLVVYAHQMALVTGLRVSSAANGTLIMATSPLLSALLAAIFYREKLTLVRISGALLGLLGVGMVVVGSGAQIGLTGWGDAIVFVAVLVFVCGGLVIQRMSRSMDPLGMLWYMYLAGGLMLVVHAALTPASYQGDTWQMTWWPWLVLLFSAVIASGVSNIVWNAGIARLGISRAALFVNWLPIFGLLFAALFLDEHVTPTHVAGLACVLGGTWLGLRRGAPAAGRSAAAKT